MSKIKVSIEGRYEVKEVPYGKDYVRSLGSRPVAWSLVSGERGACL